MKYKRIYMLCSDGVLYTGLRFSDSNESIQRCVRLAIAIGFNSLKMKNGTIRVCKEEETIEMEGLIVQDASRKDIRLFISDLLLDNITETESILLGQPKVFGNPIEE